MNLGATFVQDHDKERLINLLAAYSIKEPILSAFDKVERRKFVPQKLADAAYEDRALPIGEGQTISQPSLVASMLQELRLKGDEKILEVGTGSGFEAALLASLCKKVYTIERIAGLAKQAKKRIKQLGIRNVKVVVGDGSLGLPKYAPFDAIIVSAAFLQVPRPLVEQLKEDSRLIMPVGSPESQEVVLYKKKGGQLVETARISPVRFVPLIGKYGWQANEDRQVLSDAHI